MGEQSPYGGEACGYTLPGWDKAFDNATPCALPTGHPGPHRSTTPRHGWIAWEQPDPSCRCDDCLWAEDPMDACVVWGRVQEGQGPAVVGTQYTNRGPEAGQQHEGTTL